MSELRDVQAHKRNLQAAIEGNRFEEAKGILETLKKDVVVTEELIRESKIGITVNKLKAHENADLQKLAKEIVKKWKADVNAGKPAPAKANGSSATKAEASTSKAAAGGSSSAAPKKKEAAAPAAKKEPERKNSLLSEPRTVKTDEPVLNRIGDATRDACVEMLYNALACDSEAPSDLIAKRASALEKHIWQQNPPPDGTATYKQKIRSFTLNLKAANNPGLRASVVSGEIKIDKLYNMSPAEMASEEQQAQYRKITEQNLFNAQGAAPQQAETDAFQCGKCKQRRTMYYQMQTRSADEPMTTFVTYASPHLSTSGSLIADILHLSAAVCPATTGGSSPSRALVLSTLVLRGSLYPRARGVNLQYSLKMSAVIKVQFNATTTEC